MKVLIEQGIDIFIIYCKKNRTSYEYLMENSNDEFELFDVLIETGVYKNLKTENKLLSLIDKNHNGIN